MKNAAQKRQKSSSEAVNKSIWTPHGASGTQVFEAFFGLIHNLSLPRTPSHCFDNGLRRLAWSGLARRMTAFQE